MQINAECDLKIRDVPDGRELDNVFVVCGNDVPAMPKDLMDDEEDPSKTMTVCHCQEINDNVFNQFSDLRLLSLTKMNLNSFNFSLVANNPRLRTLILDHNPIDNLFNDAQITLENLSLRNTSLRMMPDATLDIMKHLKVLNISGEYFHASHQEVCSKFGSLEMFNGRRCNRAMYRIPPKELLQQRSDDDSSGHQWKPVSCVLRIKNTLISVYHKQIQIENL